MARRLRRIGLQDRGHARHGGGSATRPGSRCKTVFKVNEGRPNAVDLLKGGAMQLVIYTTTGAHTFSDEQAIRRTAVLQPRALHHHDERRARGGGGDWRRAGATRCGYGACRRFTPRHKSFLGSSVPAGRSRGCSVRIQRLNMSLSEIDSGAH